MKCPECGAPLVTVLFGIASDPTCIVCLWPHDDLEVE